MRIEFFGNKWIVFLCFSSIDENNTEKSTKSVSNTDTRQVIKFPDYACPNDLSFKKPMFKQEIVEEESVENYDENNQSIDKIIV